MYKNVSILSVLGIPFKSFRLNYTGKKILVYQQKKEDVVGKSLKARVVFLPIQYLRHTVRPFVPRILLQLFFEDNQYLQVLQVPGSADGAVPPETGHKHLLAFEPEGFAWKNIYEFSFELKGFFIIIPYSEYRQALCTSSMTRLRSILRVQCH